MANGQWLKAQNNSAFCILNFEFSLSLRSKTKQRDYETFDFFE